MRKVNAICNGFYLNKQTVYYYLPFIAPFRSPPTVPPAQASGSEDKSIWIFNIPKKNMCKIIFLLTNKYDTFDDGSKIVNGSCEVWLFRFCIRIYISWCINTYLVGRIRSKTCKIICNNFQILVSNNIFFFVTGNIMPTQFENWWHIKMDLLMRGAGIAYAHPTINKVKTSNFMFDLTEKQAIRMKMR